MIVSPVVVTVLAILVGMVGIAVPVLPGLLLCWLATGFYALCLGGSSGWTLFAVTTAIYLAGVGAQYALPGRRLRAAGLGTGQLAIAVLVGVVGFFVVPVVGLPLGIMVAVYVMERVRHGAAAAWPATKVALRALLLSMGVELVTSAALLVAVLYAAWRASG